MESGIQRLIAGNVQPLEDKERDWLTGLYNQTAASERINRLLEERKYGVMLLMDVDYFKKINDRYGHIVGDRVLQSVAYVLDSMVFKHDIVGRIGGDEFVVFMPVDQNREFITERCRQIRERLQEVSLSDELRIGLSVSLGGVIFRKGDTYDTMSARAASRLESVKKRRRSKGRKPPVAEYDGPSKNFVVDMRQVREELAEQTLIPGACCQDYETFKDIYRFVERRLRRVNISSYIILITLTDGQGDFPELSVREKQMEQLRELIQNSLRLGDVFTQYSSSQFLVMVSDASQDNAEMIADRIAQAYRQAVGDSAGELLLHSCYPMEPAGGSRDVI